MDASDAEIEEFLRVLSEDDAWQAWDQRMIGLFAMMGGAVVLSRTANKLGPHPRQAGSQTVETSGILEEKLSLG